MSEPIESPRNESASSSHHKRWDPSQTSSGWLNGRPPVFALKLPDGRWLLGAVAFA